MAKRANIIGCVATSSKANPADNPVVSQNSNRELAVRHEQQSAMPALVIAIGLFASVLATGQASDQSPQRTDAIAPSQPPISITVQSPPPDARRDQQEAEDRAANLKIQSRIATITGLQMLFGLGAIAVSVWATMQAKKAAEASVKAAQAAEVQATFTAAQKRVSDQQLAQMAESLTIARINADAAKQSADTAVLALEHSDRPWLRISAQFVGGVSLDSASNGIRMRIRFIAENIGRSVAQGVNIQAKVTPQIQSMGDSTPGSVGIYSYLRAKQREMVEGFNGARTPQRPLLGHRLFPGESFTSEQGLLLNLDECQQYWNQWDDGDSTALPDRILHFAVVGAVHYSYGLSEKWQVTCFGYEPEQPFTLSEPPEAIRLKWIPHGVGLGYAD